jgi:glycosyltransferase involved in cell wall biosynthesis
MVRLINHFSEQLRHTIVALDGNYEARTGVASELDVVFLPIRHRKGNTIGSILAAIFALRRLRPDLLFTYNWGAIEWAMANRLLPVWRHIHFEAGFAKGEADAQILRRVLFRRLALARCALVVVRSRRLENLARDVWRLPGERVAFVPNGVDTKRFIRLPRDNLPCFTRRPGELIIGTVAQLRPEKNIGRLLRAFATLDHSLNTRLMVVGDGIERGLLAQLAADLGIGDRVIFTGQLPPENVLSTFDIFALSSDTEQMPNALLEAMAAGCPIAAVDVGDVKRIVCEENREFIVPRDDIGAFAAAISYLLCDPVRREILGSNNQRRVSEKFSQERMFSAYSKIFAIDRLQ